jgi:hypothetical protein
MSTKQCPHPSPRNTCCRDCAAEALLAERALTKSLWEALYDIAQMEQNTTSRAIARAALAVYKERKKA